jgi:hypothetical protein
MQEQRHIVLRLCLAIILAMVVCLPGCREKEPASAADVPNDSKAAGKAAEPDLKKAEYENDLDRLDRLAERINRACRASYVVVLGAGESSVVGGTVTVDYTLFDKLSDDGAAVLVAEAIAVKSIPPSSSQMQTQTSTERIILQADETAGRYVVKAGFGSSGFTEWFKAKKLSTMGLQEDRVPEKMRIGAFMRGYTSERYSQEK